MPAESYTDRTKIDDYPWRQLDPATVEVLRPVLDDTAEEMIQAVVSSVPAYARPIEGEFGVGIVAGVQAALSHLLAEIEESGPVGRPDVYRALGQGEMRAGRSMDSLLTAYRIGARVAWRRFAAAGVEAGLDPDTLYLLAESIFAYIDVLSASRPRVTPPSSRPLPARPSCAAAGSCACSCASRLRTLPRSALPRPSAELGAAALAGRARDRRRRRAPVLPLGCRSASISEDLGEITCAVVTDPDGPGRRAEIERAVDDAGATAGLGTTVEWGRAALSFQRARAALALALAGSQPGLLSARENAGRLLLARRPGLAAELAADELAPLDELAPGSRARSAIDAARVAGGAGTARTGRRAAGRAPADSALPARSAA